MEFAFFGSIPISMFSHTLELNIFCYQWLSNLHHPEEQPGKSVFFRTFFVRRIFRIWPLFLVITVAGLLTGLRLKQPVWNALPYYLTFTMNFAAERTTDAVTNGGVEPALLLPFTSLMWSLAIEEQFYLFLPLLVSVLSPKRLPSIVTVLCTISALNSLLFLH